MDASPTNQPSRERRNQLSGTEEVNLGSARVNVGSKPIAWNIDKAVDKFCANIQELTRHWVEELRSSALGASCEISGRRVSRSTDTISITVSPRESGSFFLPPWQELHPELMELGRDRRLQLEPAGKEKQVLEALGHSWKHPEYFRGPLAIAFLYDRPSGEIESLSPKKVQVIWSSEAFEEACAHFQKEIKSQVGLEPVKETDPQINELLYRRRRSAATLPENIDSALPIEILAQKGRSYLGGMVAATVFERLREEARLGKSTRNASIKGAQFEKGDFIITFHFTSAGEKLKEVKLAVSRHQPEALSLRWEDQDSSLDGLTF